MKRVNRFLMAVLCMTFLFTSCKKFLDTEISQTSFNSPEDIFSTVSGTKGALMGTYQNLVGDNGYGIRMSLYYTVDNDEMMGPASTPYPDNTRRDIAHYSLTAANNDIQVPYGQLFQGVEQANQCIYYIQGSAIFKAGNIDQRRMLAEAYTLRAQFYFDLVKIWGDVPFFTLPHIPACVQTNTPTRTDRDTIYDHLLNDLKMIQDSGWIGWQSQYSKDERITLDFVKGLRARIALFKAGYSLRSGGSIKAGDPSCYAIARQECLELINHYGGVNSQGILSSSYEDVFRANANHVLKPEILFAAGAPTPDQTGTLTGQVSTKLGYYNGPKLYKDGTSTAYGNGSILVLPTYFYKFDSTDKRRDVTICYYTPLLSGGQTIGGYYAGATSNATLSKVLTDGKYRRDWINPAPYITAQYFGLDWIMMRYSDILLMFAEADNEFNGAPSADALSAFNQVRVRANVSPVSTSDYTTFKTLIENERSLEFGGEGIRKFDLIRWNKIVPKFAEAKRALDTLSGGYIYSNGAVRQIPTSMYWTNITSSGSLGKVVFLNQFYAKQGTQPAGAYKSSWATSSISSTGSTFSYLGKDFISGKSELFPIPLQEISMNSNLQFVGNDTKTVVYPNGQNPGY